MIEGQSDDRAEHAVKIETREASRAKEMAE
jgi:hypothetical protein